MALGFLRRYCDLIVVNDIMPGLCSEIFPDWGTSDKAASARRVFSGSGGRLTD